MKILLISSYPHNLAPTNSIFVFKLIESLFSLGCEIVVISPESWRIKVKNKELPGTKKYGVEKATVYRPKYFDFPNRARIGSFTFGRFNAFTYKLGVKRVIESLDFEPDIIYSHFLYRSGPAAIMAGKFFKVPVVVALGESCLDKYVPIFGKKNMIELIKQFDGIISVSETNKRYAMSKLGVNGESIRVFPNAVDSSLFYPRDKVAMRKKYNLAIDKFIVAFTGHFIERKGPLRVSQALEQLDQKIAGVFIGAGAQEPIGDKVLFKGKLRHNEVPEILSAADIFVLPTQNEGSCNAIAEAMACGLPIVSSDIPAVKEQINDKNSILVDPNNIGQIRDAVDFLYHHPSLVKRMSDESLAIAASTSAKHRAKRIHDFVLSIISGNEESSGDFL